MGIYNQQQQLMDSVCRDIASFRALIAPKDASKRSEFGFVPGMSNMPNEVNALDEHLRNLHEGVFQVVFVGGFNAGKSTMLNALMRKELLQAHVNAETAVIAKIVFNAKEEKAIVYKLDKEGRRTTIEHTIADFFEIYRVDQNNPNKFEDVEYAQLRQTQDGIGGSLVQFVDSPGTSNSAADDAKARKIAKKASAVVYLINAVMPFRDEDKQYIREHYAGQGLKNLFFVINRYDSVQPAQQDALKQNVRNQLHDVFTVDGRFEQELFESRVFYTNAFGSLNTRLGRKTKTAYGEFLLDDDDTGVPEFEKALGTFLTADDRDKSAFAAYVPKLSAMYTLAKAKTAEQIERYAEGKADLERKRDELDAAAVQVERVLSGIQDSCNIIAGELVRDIQRDYEGYVDLLAREWDEYFSDPNVLKNAKFNLWTFVQMVFTKGEAKKNELAKPLMEAVGSYFKNKEKVFQRDLEQSVLAATTKLENSFKNYQQQLEKIDCPVDVDEILRNIAGTLGGSVSVAPGATAPNIFQIILGLLGADLDIMIGGLVNTDSNLKAITNFIVANVSEIIFTNLFGPVGWVVWGVRTIYAIINGGKQSAQKLLLGMKDSTISGLRGAKASFAAEMERTVGGTILRVGEEFSVGYKTELAGYQESYAQAIADLDSANFNLSDEEERTKRQLEKMVDLISHISQLTGGKVLSESDVLARAEEKRSEN